MISSGNIPPVCYDVRVKALTLGQAHLSISNTIMIRNIPISDAVSALLSCTPPLSREEVPLDEAVGRVLAVSLQARVDLPPFHRSAYDGYALLSAATAHASEHAPAAFRITDTVTAGDCCRTPLEEGCCVRIMTGAPLPEGADCVINFECVTRKDDTLFLKQPLSPGQNVDRRGDEICCGAPLLEKEERLTPAHIGILASHGYDHITVYRRMRAAVLSTGSELLSPGQPLSPGKIYDSNLHVFRALLKQEGCGSLCCRHAADEEDTICRALLELAPGTDLIVTTGGASVGDKDYISRALEKAGARILFSHVSMKPGSCCLGAKLGNCLIVSLSGNPGAALTSWFLIALPAVRKLSGQSDYALREMVLPLADTWRKTCPCPRILKGHIETTGNTAHFVAHDGQKNSMQTSFLHMNALAELPPSDTPLPAGTPVRVVLP